jgi:hypothetical protein
MQIIPLAMAGLCLGITEAVADGFSPVTDRNRFVESLDQRVLQHPFYGVHLAVTPDGKIVGEALGWPVSGRWNWQNGYFCREMEWSGTHIPFNCQLVEASPDQRLRFTVDKGAGDAATFRLK